MEPASSRYALLNLLLQTHLSQSVATGMGEGSRRQDRTTLELGTDLAHPCLAPTGWGGCGG